MKKWQQNVKSLAPAAPRLRTSLLSSARSLLIALAMMHMWNIRAATATCTNSGNWESSAIWSPNRVPGAGDDVVIRAGMSITVTNNESAATLTFSNNSASLATVSVNSGLTLSVSGAVTLQNGAAVNTLAAFTGAGTLTCSSLKVAGTTTPTTGGTTTLFASAISTLSIGGNLTLAGHDGGANAQNKPTFSVIAGSVNVGGTVIGTETGSVAGSAGAQTVSLTFNLQPVTFRLSGATPFSTPSGQFSFQPNGASATVLYSFDGAQTVFPATYKNLTLAGSGVKTTSAVTVNGILSLQGTATVGNPVAYVGNAVLEYAGSTVQTTSVNEFPAAMFASVHINNALGVTLDAAKTVNTNLSLIIGVLTSSPYQVNLASGATLTGGGSNSYVNGKLQKSFATTGSGQSFTFPIGDISNYTPLTLASMNVTQTGTLTASSTSGDHPNIVASAISSARSVNRYWTLTPGSSFAANYNATFYYLPGDIDAGASAAQFLVQQNASGLWSNATVSGTPTTTTTTITGQTVFGDFIIGDINRTQTITFPSPGNQIYGAGPITLLATSSSGLAVAYSVTGPANVSGATLNITGAGSVSITASQAGNASWDPAIPVTQMMTVSPRPVTVSGVTASDKVYDTTLAASLNTGNASLVAVVNGDNVALDVSNATGAFSSKDVGNGKTVTVSGLALAGASAANYTLSQPTTTASITPATLTVRADDKSRAWDLPNPSLTVTYRGFASGESANILSGSPLLNTAAQTNSPPGPYTITAAPGTLTAPNYNTAFVDGTLTVLRDRPITIGIVNNGDGTVTVTFQGTPTGQYFVQATSDLSSSNSWSNISTNTAGSDGFWIITDSMAGNLQRFYRGAIP